MAKTAVLLLLAALPALALAACTHESKGYCYTQRPAGKLGKHDKAFVVVGDSFSDVGNGWDASGRTFPEPTHGYWQGHYTNGYMWPEHVQNNTGAFLIDTAGSGSTAADPTKVNGQLNSGISFPVPDLDMQATMLIDVYKTSLKSKSTTYIWAGTADISYLIMSVLGLSGPNTTTAGQIDGPTAFKMAEEVPKAVGATAEKLLKAGFTRDIIISTLQPIEAQPIWKYGIALMPKEFQAGAFQLIQGLTQTVNAGIWAEAERLGMVYKKKAKIQVFDAYSYYYGIINTAAVYNITQTSEACVISAPVPVLPTDLSATEIASTCTNPQNYMFWDSSHPTALFHALLGAQITHVLKVSGFPVKMGGMTY